MRFNEIKMLTYLYSGNIGWQDSLCPLFFSKVMELKLNSQLRPQRAAFSFALAPWVEKFYQKKKKNLHDCWKRISFSSTFRSSSCYGGGHCIYLFPIVFIFWFILSKNMCTPASAFMHGRTFPQQFPAPDVWLLAFQVGTAPVSSCSHLLKWIFAQYWLALNPQQCLSFACGIQGSSLLGMPGEAGRKKDWM